MKQDKIILGMDPGTNLMGYGLIHCKGNQMSMIEMGVLELGKLETAEMKLKRIFDRTLNLIDTFHPDHLAIEAPFYGKNVQSMLKLGKAQGVAIAAALYREVPMTEYSPKRIKQSITGNGNASKEQVAAMLKSLLKIQQMPRHLDATDGLAAAVCHFFQKDTVGEEKSYSGWKSFVSKNPDKLK